MALTTEEAPHRETGAPDTSIPATRAASGDPLSLQRALGNTAFTRLLRQGHDALPAPPPTRLREPTLDVPSVDRPSLPSPGTLTAGHAPVSSETMAALGRRLAAAAAERRRRELNAIAQVRAAQTGHTTIVIDAARNQGAWRAGGRLRDITLAAQYGVALGFDLISGAPGYAAQGVVDFGVIYHGPVNPDDDNSPDPGGFELHFQAQVNSDALNRGRLSAQANVQGTLAWALAQGAWGNAQASVFGQLSLGSAYDSHNNLNAMFGGAGGGQVAATFNLGGNFQIQGALQVGAGLQDVGGELQAPFQVVGAVSIIFDTHSNQLGGGRRSTHGDGNPW